MAYTYREKFRDFTNQLRYYFAWLSVRKDTPKIWFSGSYSWIKVVRFSLVIFSLLNFAALALGSPNWNVASFYSLWLGFASAAFILIAIIYFLGLRMWYGPVAGFLIIAAIINYIFDAAGGPDALSPINRPSFNDLIALTWLYLVVVGIVIMRYDKGSKLNELLKQS